MNSTKPFPVPHEISFPVLGLGEDLVDLVAVEVDVFLRSNNNGNSRVDKAERVSLVYRSWLPCRMHEPIL